MLTFFSSLLSSFGSFVSISLWQCNRTDTQCYVWANDSVVWCGYIAPLSHSHADCWKINVRSNKNRNTQRGEQQLNVKKKRLGSEKRRTFNAHRSLLIVSIDTHLDIHIQSTCACTKWHPFSLRKGIFCSDDFSSFELIWCSQLKTSQTLHEHSLIFNSCQITDLNQLNFVVRTLKYAIIPKHSVWNEFPESSSIIEAEKNKNWHHFLFSHPKKTYRNGEWTFRMFIRFPLHWILIYVNIELQKQLNKVQYQRKNMSERHGSKPKQKTKFIHNVNDWFHFYRSSNYWAEVKYSAKVFSLK